MSDNKHWHIRLAAVDDALAYGGKLYDNIVDDFNAAIDHVLTLSEDATVLFERGSFPTSAFLSITAMEETGKAHVAAFRKDRGDGVAKGRDPLRDHRAKHRMAILPTVFMGARLFDALGADRCEQLHQEAQTTGFVATREAGNLLRGVAALNSTPLGDCVQKYLEMLERYLNLLRSQLWTKESEGRLRRAFVRLIASAQNRRLSHRNIAVRFSLNSRHYQERRSTPHAAGP